MGCTCNSKQNKWSQSLQLANGASMIKRVDNDVQTWQGQLENSSSLLNIGQEVHGLGQLKQEVQEVLNALGTYPPIKDLDEQNGQYEFVQYNDGSIFQGQIKNGKRNGIGRQHWLSEGNYLEGIWSDDKVHGQARMIYPNGDIFEGQLIGNKAHGQGVFRNKKKEVKGTWLDNKLQGHGVEIRKNGIKYEGQYADGIIQGRGQFYFPDGRQYIGEVHQGQIHGEGVMTWPDLSYYKGNFRYNQLKGYGCYTDINGNVYVGQFISVYHPDMKKLDLLYSKESNIQDCNKLKKFCKQYGL